MLLEMFTYGITNRSGAKFKKMERAGLHVMFYYYSACLHLGKDERKLQYSRNNIQGMAGLTSHRRLANSWDYAET
jgi:hypothetical protein